MTENSELRERVEKILWGEFTPEAKKSEYRRADVREAQVKLEALVHSEVEQALGDLRGELKSFSPKIHRPLLAGDIDEIIDIAIAKLKGEETNAL